MSRLASVLLLVLWAAQALAAGFQSRDLLRLRRVEAVALRPQGDEVAYTLRVPRDPLEQEEDGSAWVELHVVDPDGRSRPFVTGEVRVSGVAWTPDGSAISFVAKREGDEAASLYLIPRDGGEARRILEHPTGIGGYVWDPEGERVAFLAPDSLPSEKKRLRERGFDQEVFEEDRRPTRVWIATIGSEEPPRRLELPGSARALAWSPDGELLAVALAPTPLTDDDLIRRKLVIVSVTGGEIVGRVDNPGKLGRFVWSPDGRRLAFLAARDEEDPLAGRLMVTGRTGGAYRELLPDFEGHFRAIAWQADSILYLADQGVWTLVGEVTPDGARHKVHLGPEGPVLTAMSVSRDGLSLAFVGETPEHPREVFFLRHGDPGLRRLTVSNPWLAEVELARQEPLTYEARDGLELEGILLHPLGEEPGRRYPLILVVHGGPEGHFRNGWVTDYARPGQVAAARGFVVFYPNYRASTGRGVAFSELDHGDPAGREFDDLVDAIRHLSRRGLVDSTRVGITGGSYGGYASAWGATRLSRHFAASVAGFGLADLISFTGTTDIPDEMYQVHFRRWPWEDWAFMLDRSPIRHAEGSRTATLILTGRNDARVPPTQSMELYRYLKKLGRAPVRLVVYPNEGHGLGRWAHRLDYNLRLLRWMEHYLKGPGGEPPPWEIDYEEMLGGRGTGAESPGENPGG
jgi:dipeptidyl aminopeptidase/acylaminoacyl peptidase